MTQWTIVSPTILSKTKMAQRRTSVPILAGDIRCYLMMFLKAVIK